MIEALAESFNELPGLVCLDPGIYDLCPLYGGGLDPVDRIAVVIELRWHNLDTILSRNDILDDRLTYLEIERIFGRIIDIIHRHGGYDPCSHRGHIAKFVIHGSKRIAKDVKHELAGSIINSNSSKAKTSVKRRRVGNGFAAQSAVVFIPGIVDRVVINMCKNCDLGSRQRMLVHSHCHRVIKNKYSAGSDSRVRSAAEGII